MNLDLVITQSKMTASLISKAKEALRLLNIERIEHIERASILVERDDSIDLHSHHSHRGWVQCYADIKVVNSYIDDLNSKLDCIKGSLIVERTLGT